LFSFVFDDAFILANSHTLGKSDNDSMKIAPVLLLVSMLRGCHKKLRSGGNKNGLDLDSSPLVNGKIVK
jgi:hypothetical protein